MSDFNRVNILFMFLFYGILDESLLGSWSQFELEMS